MRKAVPETRLRRVTGDRVSSDQYVIRIDAAKRVAFE